MIRDNTAKQKELPINMLKNSKDRFKDLEHINLMSRRLFPLNYLWKEQDKTMKLRVMLFFF